MQNTLFKKYFSIFVSLILVSLSVLGIILMIFSSDYRRQERYDELTVALNKAEKILTVDVGKISYDSQYLKDLSDIADCEIALYNSLSQKAIYCTEISPCNHMNEDIPQFILDIAVDSGVYKETGTLNQIYENKHYTVVRPLIDSQNQISGYIMATSEIKKPFDSFLWEMLKMFLISEVCVFVVVMIIVNFVTYEMVKPLSEMSEAAKEFGKGDFSKRLPVERYDEIGQLAMSMNNMAESLSVLENMRRSFVSNVSHELKTPMTTIGGFIDGILDGTIPKENHKQYLRIVSDEVKRLSRVVRSMLNLAQIEAGEMKLKPQKVDIIDTICQTLFTLEGQIENKKLDIKGLDREKIYVEADGDLIHQVIYNLVENAIKFSNEGGYIEFSFTKEGNDYLIGVKNSGEGLSREEIPRVFDRFYKTDKSRGLDKNGVGLGLYIVHSIINLHGGEIIVKSVKGEYCEFLFSLPALKQLSKFKKKLDKEDNDFDI